jgi:flagellar hook protein FlgE
VAGLIDGLLAGRAGIESFGTAISVLADNISNSGTVGDKQSRADFADVLAQEASLSQQVGAGSQVISTTPIFTQGTFESTGRGLDVAIDGNGFFVLNDAAGSGATSYSRAGNFSIDKQGYLVDQNGFRVMGVSSAAGAGGLVPFNVNSVASSAVQTSSVSISGNLDASSPIAAAPGGSPSFQTLAAAAQGETTIDVQDSLGFSHTVTTFFFHTGTGQWQANSYVDAGEVNIGPGGTPGTPGTPAPIGSATLTFGPNGARVTPVPSTDFTATPPWSNGSSPGNIKFSFQNFSQVASPFGISGLSQDGRASGNVVQFTFDQSGVLSAQLDNGQSVSLGTLALATFSDPERLQRLGHSLYSASSESGEPVTGRPGTGSLGKIQSGSLEDSTSDLAGDFVKLIGYQRGYQGSSRVITTINDLQNEILNIVR